MKRYCYCSQEAHDIIDVYNGTEEFQKKNHLGLANGVKKFNLIKL